MDEEGLKDTQNKMIHIGRPIEIDEERFEKELEALKHATDNEEEDIRPLIKQIVPTYNPKGE